LVNEFLPKCMWKFWHGIPFGKILGPPLNAANLHPGPRPSPLTASVVNLHPKLDKFPMHFPRENRTSRDTTWRSTFSVHGTSSVQSAFLVHFTSGSGADGLDGLLGLISYMSVCHRKLNLSKTTLNNWNMSVCHRQYAMQTIMYSINLISIPLTNLNSYGCCESTPEKFNTTPVPSDGNTCRTSKLRNSQAPYISPRFILNWVTCCHQIINNFMLPISI
jgi:hypothetical protein